MSSQTLFKREFVKVLESRLAEKDPLIQVILGPRQVGKTTGVESLFATGESSQGAKFHYVTADDALALSQDWIFEQWQAALVLGPDVILVIDEVQKVLHWSESIKKVWDASKRKKAKVKLVLLGSSSLSISQGLEESLAGRFEVIPAPHWGYEESRAAFGYSLEDYFLFGDYPAASRFRTDFERWQSYLKNSIIETVIGKDILRLRSVRHPGLFRQAFEIIASYPSQEMSYNKLLGQIQEKGNIDLVKHYLDLFEGAFLFRCLQKYTGSAQMRKASSPKIIPLCPALYSYQITPEEVRDPEIRGRIFESCVGSELANLPGDLFYWRDGDFEVDFVHVRGSQVTAIEVKSGRRKRTQGLMAFCKKFPRAKKVFVTLENFGEFAKAPVNFLNVYRI